MITRYGISCRLVRTKQRFPFSILICLLNKIYKLATRLPTRETRSTDDDNVFKLFRVACEINKSAIGNSRLLIYETKLNIEICFSLPNFALSSNECETSDLFRFVSWWPPRGWQGRGLFTSGSYARSRRYLRFRVELRLQHRTLPWAKKPRWHARKTSRKKWSSTIPSISKPDIISQTFMLKLSLDFRGGSNRLVSIIFDQTHTKTRRSVENS